MESRVDGQQPSGKAYRGAAGAGKRSHMKVFFTHALPSKEAKPGK